MKILKLDLRAFGPFTGATLDLSAGSEGLHVIYGRNEAGKSSALRAIEQMLFGIPPRAADDFIHPYKNLRVGATLGRRDGPPLAFLRRKGTLNTLLADDNETPLDESLLRPLLGALDRELFVTMFGIDHPQLVQGGKEIVHGSGNVGQLLFAAGAGIADLQAIQARLEDEAGSLFTRRAPTRRINQTLKALEEARKKARQAQLPGDEWAQHDQALRQSKARRQEVETQWQELQRQQARWQRIRQALPAIAERGEQLHKRQALGNVRILPADFAEQRRRAVTDLEIARKEAQNAREESQRLRQQIGALDIPGGLLAQGAAIQELSDALGSHRKAQRDLPGLHARREQALRAAAQILRQIRPELGLEVAQQLRLTTVQQVAIRELGNHHEALVQNLAKAGDEIHETQQLLADEQSQLDAPPSPRPAGPLKDALRRAQGQGDLEAQLSDARSDLARIQQQAAVDRERLPGAPGTLDELEKLAVPDVETIDRFQQELDDAQRQVELVEVRLDESAAARADIDRRLQQSRLEGEVPTEEDLLQARELRDQGWLLVIEAWQQASINAERQAEFLAHFPPGLDLAAAYAQAVAQADRCADRLRREARRVADLASLRASREAQDRQIGELAQQIQGAQAARLAAEQAWSACWRPAAIEPGSPRQMRAWLQRQQALAQQAAAIRARRADAQRLEERIAASRRQLLDVLQEPAPPATAAPEGLAAIVDHCQAVVEQWEALQARRQQQEKSIRQLRQRLASAQERAERARAALAQWRQQWALAVEPLGLPADTTPMAAIQVLAETVDLLARLAEAQELTERIEAIATDAATFRRQVEQLTAEAASDLAGQEAEASAATLIARHQQARIDEQARDKLRQQHERQQAAEKTARATIDKLTARLTAMCQEAGCQRPEELPEAERASEAASRLDESLRALDAQLLGLSAGAGIEALIAEAQGQSADELPANLERLQLQIQECGTERDALQHAIGVEETKLGAMRSGAEAADAAEEVQELLAELETDVPQYVRLRLASAVLREGIERYRRKNEGPVLRRASELFAQLTLGSFERLSADCDERGQQVLKGVRPGGAGTVELAGMSEGTSDQLYLALRLASLESYLEGRAPVPFIVDDVLVSFDDGRASAALGALADLSRRTQVIFFTHHAHLVDLARKGLAADTLFVHEL